MTVPRQKSRTITITTMQSDVIMAAVEAVSPLRGKDEGHRTRAGLTPHLAAKHLAKAAAKNGERACVILQGEGAVLAVRFREEAKTTKPWEACAVAGYPTDDAYREAYQELFGDEERTEPERSRPDEPAPLPAPKDPRPTPDGWAISKWIINRRARVCNSRRVVAPLYEDCLRPDPPGSCRGARIIRPAEPYE